MTAILFIAQRASAAVLAFFVTVHLATILYAVRGGLTAGEVLARTRDNHWFFAFYVSVRAGGRGACADRACAMSFANGRRGTAVRSTWRWRCSRSLLLALGFRAAVAVYLPPEVLLG